MSQVQHTSTLTAQHLAGEGLWPAVIGTLSMVMGIRGIFSIGYGGGAGLTFLLGLGPGRRPFLPDGWDMAIMAAESVHTAANLLLIVAGLLVWRRRRLGGVLHILSALAAIPCAAAMPVLFLGRFPQHELREIVYSQIQLAMVGLPYPVFVLVWFRRKKIRREARTWPWVRGGPPRRRPTPIWPTVLGAVSMVLGGYGILGHFWGLGRQLWEWRFQLGPEASVSSASLWGGLYFDPIGLALIVLLLVGGWLLCRRRRVAAACLVLFAILAALYTALTYLRSLATNWNLSGWVRYYFLARIGLQLLVSMAFPVFLLVWFSRANIRRQVRAWRAADAGAASESG